MKPLINQISGEKLETPNALVLESANICNAKCIFCPLFHGTDIMRRDKRPVRCMEQGLFQNIINQIETWPSPPQYIFLNMFGEPLLDKGLKEKIEYLSYKNLSDRVLLQTNAQFLTEEIAEVICRNNIGYLRPSLDSHRPDVFETLRKGCDFNTVRKNIVNFANIRNNLHANTKIQIQVVCTTLNTNDPPFVFKLFKSHMKPGLDSLCATKCVPWNSRYLDETGKAIYRLGSSMINNKCSLLEDYLIVLADGEVSACCFDYNLEVAGALGSACDTSLLEIWNSPKRLNIINRIRKYDTKNLPSACKCCSALFGYIPKEHQADFLSNDNIEYYIY